MKKIMSIIAIFAVFTIFIFTGNSYATALNTVDVQTDKTTVRPGENVKLTIQFGQELGAYTFDISYDNNIFEYVSSEGGTSNDTNGKVKVTYYDTTGGSSPRSNMSVTFKAKENITTSNPTELTVTAEGLANADASVTFDDITTPIVKNITVEPEYVDYTLKLEHKGELIKGKENQMTLSYSSPMGHYYEHARLVAEATTPTGATVKLLATDQARLEHDIIQSGWGDAQGFKIGGKDVKQELQVRGVFSEAGDYSITLKLIDRDNSDHVIAEGTFRLTVKEEEQTTPPANEPEEDRPVPPTTKPENNETLPETNNQGKPTTQEENKVPTTLPKTGKNIYFSSIFILIALMGSYVYFNKKK